MKQKTNFKNKNKIDKYIITQKENASIYQSSNAGLDQPVDTNVAWIKILK